MAENIKIYRNINKKLGFTFNELQINNLYVDQTSLRKLIQHINKQFLICSNKQSMLLLEGCVDYDNRIITILCCLIILPLLKSVIISSYANIFLQYLTIFLGAFLFIGYKFVKASQLKQKYIQAQQQLQDKFYQIQDQFNSRFDYLSMEYNKSYNDSEQDYLEIKFIKLPVPIKSIQGKAEQIIELLPIEN